MIQLRKDTDLAFFLLSHMMSQPKGTRTSAKAMAVQLHLPYPTVSKILKLLNKNGIVHSIQGSKGGYGLSDQYQRFSMGEVIECIEGPIALTVCADASTDDCVSKPYCKVHPHMLVINRVIRGSLMSLPITVLSQKLRKPPKSKDITSFWEQFFLTEERIEV